MRRDLIQWRRGTAAEWTAADPVLENGEPGYETDTRRLKVGDGVTAWTALGYATEVAASALTPDPSNSGFYLV